MTPIEQAEERGHSMARWPDATGREQWACTRCAATLLRDEKNPNGWGSSLDRDCPRSAA